MKRIFAIIAVFLFLCSFHQNAVMTKKFVPVIFKSKEDVDMLPAFLNDSSTPLWISYFSQETMQTESACFSSHTDNVDAVIEAWLELTAVPNLIVRIEMDQGEEHQTLGSSTYVQRNPGQDTLTIFLNFKPTDAYHNAPLDQMISSLENTLSNYWDVKSLSERFLQYEVIVNDTLRWSGIEPN